MKILATGSAGLVGWALQRIAGEYPHHEFIFATRRFADLTNRRETQEMFYLTQPEGVIHLAARVGGVEANMKAPATFLQENLVINCNVLDAALSFGVRHLVAMCSTCVFPAKCPLPLESPYMNLGPPHESNYGYAYAKRILATQCQAFNEQFGVCWTPMIPCNIYGPGDNFSPETSHVIPALIHRMAEAKMTKKPMVVWGSGRPEREFLCNRDAALAALMLLEHGDGKPVIVSPGKSHKIRWVVQKLVDLFDFRHGVEWDVTKPEGQFRKPSNGEQLLNLMHGTGFDFISLDDGLRMTVDWFKRNRSIANENSLGHHAPFRGGAASSRVAHRACRERAANP